MALAALKKEEKTIAQLASEFGISSIQINRWKKQLLQGSPEIFERKGYPLDLDALSAPLYQEIGRLKMKLDWLKKIRL